MGIVRNKPATKGVRKGKLAALPAKAPAAIGGGDNDTAAHRRVDALPVSSIADARARKRINELATDIRDLNEQIRELEALKAGHTAELTVLGVTHKLGKVAGEGWLVLPPVGRKVLKKELLIEQGVTMEQIELATVEEPGKNYSVRKRED